MCWTADCLVLADIQKKTGPLILPAETKNAERNKDGGLKKGTETSHYTFSATV